MYLGGLTLMCLFLSATQLLRGATCLEPIDDPELRAHLEHKVISSMSLKDIEAMVENDERVINAPKSKYIIIPKGQEAKGLVGDDQREALVIHRKPKKSNRRSEHRYADEDFHPRDVHSSRYEPAYGYEQRGGEFPQRRYEPAYGFERNFDDFDHGRRSDDFASPLFFGVSDLDSAHSTPVRQFYESLVDSVMSKKKFGLERDPFAILEMAASESEPSYAPRFDYGAYAKDSTATKLEGKPYWKDAPERRDETVDENGCRTVVKRIVDPDAQKSGDEKAKSVVITKECEYPTLSGPDAKIAEATPYRHHTSRYDAPPLLSPGFSSDKDVTYEKARPKELDIDQAEGRDPIKPDYIDSMLEKHFKSFNNPLAPFRGFQDRFKLRLPDTFKNIKPTVDVKSYEYSNPKSGFDDDRESSEEEDSSREHRHSYEYPQQQQQQQHQGQREYKRDDKPEEKSSDDDSKEPKMLKKSFAYYRKDNPKSEPDDHQYAEEYAHGNYRSFSSSYDSEKDGPKKKE